MKFKGCNFNLIIAVFVLVSVMIFTINVADASSYQTINVNGLSTLIAKDQRIKLVFLFTSWCPYCKKGYEKVLDIAEKHNSKKLLVLPISVDEKTTDLDDFLTKYAKSEIVKVNYKLQGDTMEVHKLSDLGINFGGSIPYIALFDDQNKVVMEGRFDEKYLEALISLLVKNK